MMNLILVVIIGCLFDLQLAFAESVGPSENLVHNEQFEHEKRIQSESPLIRIEIPIDDEVQFETTYETRHLVEIDDQNDQNFRQSRVEAHLMSEPSEDPLIVWQESMREHDTELSQPNREMFDDIINQEILDNLPEIEEINNRDTIKSEIQIKNESSVDQNKVKKIEMDDIENHVLPLMKVSSQMPQTSIMEHDYDTRVDENEDRILGDVEIDDAENHRKFNHITVNYKITKKYVIPTSENPESIKTLTSKTPYEKTLFSTLPSIMKKENKKSDQMIISTPESYVIIVLNLPWSTLCDYDTKLRATIAAQLTALTDHLIQPSQIVLLTTDLGSLDYHLGRLNIICHHSNSDSVEPITVMAYVETLTGQPDLTLTMSLSDVIGSAFQNVIMEIQLFPKEKEKQVNGRVNSQEEQNYTGIIAAFTISGIAGTSLVILCVLLLVLRFRHKRCNEDTRRRAIFDTYSLDSISIYSSIRRKRNSLSKRSYLNLGFTDPCGPPSHRINFAGLANMCIAQDTVLEEEFQSIPNDIKMIEMMKVNKTETNAIENPDINQTIEKITRNQLGVNFIRGHKDKPNVYLTCQIPQNETIQYFWKMIWDEEIRVIVMLNGNDEESVSKLTLYYPTLESDSHKLFGDYQISLKSQEKLQHYIVSRLEIRDLEKNLMRDLTHFCYTSWNSKQMPTNLCSVLAVILEARACINVKNPKPLLVHCSNGAERSGTFVAIDLCMKQFEENRTVDIPLTVCTTRQQCVGAIRTFSHYSFMYKVLNEYTTRLEKPSLVRCDNLAPFKTTYNPLKPNK